MKTPQLSNLTLLKWIDNNQRRQRCRVIPTTANKWRTIAPLVGISYGDIDSIWEEERANPRCNQRVFGKWIENGGYGIYYVTWEGLCELLEDIENGQLALEVKEALLSKGIHVN